MTRGLRDRSAVVSHVSAFLILGPLAGDIKLSSSPGYSLPAHPTHHTATHAASSAEVWPLLICQTSHSLFMQTCLEHDPLTLIARLVIWNPVFGLMKRDGCYPHVATKGSYKWSFAHVKENKIVIAQKTRLSLALSLSLSCCCHGYRHGKEFLSVITNTCLRCRMWSQSDTRLPR